MESLITLNSNRWRIGEPVAHGGFGHVYQASCDEVSDAVAKLVDQEPGADRELLVGDSLRAADLEHVVPLLDSGPTPQGDQYVLVMPRAEASLRQYIDKTTPLGIDDVVTVLTDITLGLAEISRAGIVHRDLKPENVLRHDGTWKLCDFGISRYRDASTSSRTRKHAMTPVYAAPEQWREERATPATDVYALGVIAYELLVGAPPFTGDAPALRDQHLHTLPPQLTTGTSRLRLLVEECLEKAPQARPTAEQVVRRLERAAEAPAGSGARRLAEANRLVADQAARDNAEKQRQMTREEARAKLFDAALRTFRTIPASLQEALETDAPHTRIKADGDSLVATLANGELTVSRPQRTDQQDYVPFVPFDVIAHTSITVTRPPDSTGYKGRSHSLWYCDARRKGDFAWHELAFMGTGGGFLQVAPFSLPPQRTQYAFQKVLGGAQLAWPVERLERDDLSKFIDRWLSWFADAAQRRLHIPSRLPEKTARGTFRTS
ncbi:serine/threonine-protein kinase [Actinomyces wuliandei]|uniref:serine/threonine-protein kinase n=1 Tax=Actinomyces wuliandei TaxID=2057743 RepID=UPI0011186BE1|nr:serine/threonine-protein kinase [Actinomyces wuliandei]